MKNIEGRQSNMNAFDKLYSALYYAFYYFYVGSFRFYVQSFVLLYKKITSDRNIKGRFIKKFGILSYAC